MDAIHSCFYNSVETPYMFSISFKKLPFKNSISAFYCVVHDDSNVHGSGINLISQRCNAAVSSEFHCFIHLNGLRIFLHFLYRVHGTIFLEDTAGRTAPIHGQI